MVLTVTFGVLRDHMWLIRSIKQGLKTTYLRLKRCAPLAKGGPQGGIEPPCGPAAAEGGCAIPSRIGCTLWVKGGEEEGELSMSHRVDRSEQAKSAAAARAVELIEDGMKLGLGTGSTAAFMVRHLAQRINREGLNVVGVPTSRATADLAASLGVPLTTLDEAQWLDLTIDGADEFDPALDLIKGGGAALLREKIVAMASARMVVITDASKEVAQLGAFALPVEVIPFGCASTMRQIAEILAACDVAKREIAVRTNDGAPIVTDQGNHIVDLRLGRIGDAPALSRVLNQVPGVVENGLFIGVCSQVIIANTGDDGDDIRVITR